MENLLGEVLKGFKEYFEWAKAPEESASLIRALSARQDERVLYKGFAQYINAQRRIDTSAGVIVVTDERFVYLAKKTYIPFVKTTERLNVPLKSLKRVEGMKYGLAGGSSVQFEVNNHRHIFLLKHLRSFATLQQAAELARLIKQAQE